MRYCHVTIGVPSAVFFYTLVPPPSSLRSGFKNEVFLCSFVPNMSLLETIPMENAVSKPLDGEEASFSSASASCPEDSCDEWSSSLLSQTPATFYEDIMAVPGAPKKEKSCTMYLCRTQIPPPASLREEWSLREWGVGSWGYEFKYEVGELWLYQLGDGESLNHSSTTMVLNAEDWAAMKLMVKMSRSWNKNVTSEENPNEEKVPCEDSGLEEKEEKENGESVQTESPVKRPREEKEEEEENGERVQSETEKCPKEEKEEEKENGERAPGECENPRQWRGVRFNDNELAKTRIILSTMWSPAPTVSGRWMTRASLRSTDIFVLERFNPDCGLFRTVLLIPATEWLSKMLGIKKRITTLFQCCCSWRDVVIVRKIISF